MAGFTALVRKHLYYLGMVVSCHFDIIPGFLDWVHRSWHDTSTVAPQYPAINQAPSASTEPHSFPELAATDKPAHPCHQQLVYCHTAPFYHWGAPGPVLAQQMVLLPSVSHKPSVATGNPELEGVLPCQSMGTAPARVEVGSFLQKMKDALLKAADRGSRQDVHGPLSWGPAWAVCTLISSLPFPVPYWACPAAQPEDGIHVPPHPSPCWLIRPPGSLGRGETASDASDRAAGKMDLMTIWPNIFQQSEQIF